MYTIIIKQINVISVVPMVLFPVAPFASVLLFAFLLATSKTKNNNIFYLFFFFLALFLGLINSTKIPESDLQYYYQSFLDAKSYSFIEYLLINGKEPVFFIFNYLSYYLTNGNTQLYIIISTVIAYLFFFVAIQSFFVAHDSHRSLILFAVLLAAFFPQLFSLSAHLIRQFIAASILMFAIVQKLFFQKKVWYYLLIAFFIHSTTILFIPLLYVKYLNKKFSLKVIIIVLFILGSISFLVPIIGNVTIKVIGNNFLTYALLRAAAGTTKELEPLGFLSFITMGALVLISLIKQYQNSEIIKTGFIHFSNIFLLFIAFIILNLQMEEISVRFFFYTYFFFPFVFPLALKSNEAFIKYIQLIIVIILVPFFIYRLQFGTWEYAPINQIVFGNIFSFLH